MPEGVVVRYKDGIVRNVTVLPGDDGTFRRNNDVFVSRGHYQKDDKIMHCCETQNTGCTKGTVFSRVLPTPFNYLLLFGDLLFILTDRNGVLRDFGLQDFNLFNANFHPDLSPGYIIQPNTRRTNRSESIVYDEEEDETTQEATTGTFVTNEEEEDESSDDNVSDEDNELRPEEQED